MKDNLNDLSAGIWFVYDGDCPICCYAAQAVRLKKQFGALHLLDARANMDHPLYRAIATRKIDLDKGMVIYLEGRFYHGKKALKFMAQLGESKGFLNALNAAVFRSEILVTLIYPVMRSVRNLLLRLRGKPQINNLKKVTRHD